jgi:hypothetical protein
LATKNVNILDTFLKDQIQKDNLLGAIAMQVGLVDLLKSLVLLPTVVYGDSWGKIVSDYYYGLITIEEAALTAYKVSQESSNIHFDGIAKFNSLLKPVPKRQDRYFSKNLKNLELRGHETLLKIPKNSLVLNVSDQKLDNKDVLLLEGNLVNFLEVVGRYLSKSRL